ncbi:MFS transporter [Devosia sp. 66-22]|uniref:MFS transporter n=1 Tax=Devosia sp. 66-22 TaxID=1895753 RepID=UPI000926F631|nr:MFS transporter [Devosia sp. 66-22]OJX51552.1 MAG: MFS transporter [Devosia sp. 66-22]
MNTRIVPLILAVALFMENMDSTVIATSLAEIARDIGTEPVALKLALTAYLVALAIFIPISSWMADRFGAKNVFRVAMVVFVIGSVCCALSNSLLTFVLSRFLQGMGGAMMTPVARLVLVRVTPRNQLVDAMAWLSIPGLVGPIVGPPIGGFITTYASWHWIFLINVPIGLLGLVAVSIFLPDWHRNAPRRMDFAGFVLCGTAFAGWVFGISVVTLPALPISFGIGALLGGTIAALIYLWHFRRTDYPLLDLRLFRLPIFRATMIGGTFFRLGTGAMPFLFPLMLQLAFGLNAFQTGTITFASAVGASAAKFAAEKVLQVVGFRNAMIVATAGTIAGVIGMGLYSPQTPVWLMMTLLVLTGFVQSIFWTATNAFVFADVDDKDAGQANVISQVGVQLSLAFGVALGGGALELFRLSHGGESTLLDFHLSFYVIAAIGIISTVIFARLPKNAGANLSGHGGGGGGGH